MSERVSVRTDGGEVAEVLLSHLHSAYNLANWLVRNDHDAEDIVQEAYLRALRHADGFRGGDARAWLITIVRNTAYSWLRKTRSIEPLIPFDEEMAHAGAGEPNPEQQLLQKADGRLVEQAMSQLPVRFREILVLRELEGFSYKQIAEVMGVPMGTVMSSLSRARARFRNAVLELLQIQGSSPDANAAKIPTPYA